MKDTGETEERDESHIDRFTASEVREELKKMAKRKCADAKGLVVEMLQQGTSPILLLAEPTARRRPTASLGETRNGEQTHNSGRTQVGSTLLLPLSLSLWL